MTNKEQRRHMRTKFKCRVKIWHPSIGERVVVTRDISDGGIFLIKGDGELPKAGEVIKGKIIDGPPDAPEVTMQVAREVDDGVGLVFVFDEEDD